MRKQVETEIKVGVFVAIGLILTMLAILILGSTTQFLARKNGYVVRFPSVEGLVTGAKVVLGGLQIGTVSNIAFDAGKSSMKVDLSVARENADWIRADTKAEIVTQGVLGDKYIALSTGSQEADPLPAGSEITVRPSKDLSQFISKGDQLLVNLNSLAVSLDRMVKAFESGNRSEIFFQGMASTAKNLSQLSDKLNREMDGLKLNAALGKLNSILEKVNNGTGTLGALVNDPSLYDSAKALVGEVNRNRIMRNLVRQTIRKADESASEQPREEQIAPQDGPQPRSGPK